jgi:hypothetical protein
MAVDANTVTAIATSVYGAATLLLVIQIWRDRIQRERHFRAEADGRKINELRSAFYEAWGYWQGHIHRSGDSVVDASQAGRQFEALTRLECQLRLNGYLSEANNLGLAVRTNLSGVVKPLAEAGTALGLFPIGYSRGAAVS